MAEPARTMTVRWPYDDTAELGAPVRFGKRLIGHVTAVHLPGDPSDDTVLEITLADGHSEDLVRSTLKGLTL